MGLINIFKPRPLSSYQRSWLTSATLIIFHLKFLWECCESNPGLLGEKQVCYLCAMQPPPTVIFVSHADASFVRLTPGPRRWLQLQCNSKIALIRLNLFLAISRMIAWPKKWRSTYYLEFQQVFVFDISNSSSNGLIFFEPWAFSSSSPRQEQALAAFWALSFK